MTEMYEKIGFKSEQEFKDSLERIIQNNPYNISQIDLLGITKLNRATENSEIFSVATRLYLPERKQLQDFTLKKYLPDSNNFDKEKLIYQIAGALIKPSEHSFTRERKIYLFPKSLKDNFGDFNDKKIIVTETVDDLTLYDFILKHDNNELPLKHENIVWDKISHTLDPTILLLDYLPYLIQKNQEVYKEMKNLELKDYAGEFDFLFEKCNEVDKSPKTLIQSKINLGNNNIKSLIDGSGLIYGKRSFYFGAQYGHPFISNQIKDIAKQAHEGYKWRRSDFKKNEIYDLESIGMFSLKNMEEKEFSEPELKEFSDQFEKGFNLGALYGNLSRIKTLKKIYETADEKQRVAIYYELDTLKAGINQNKEQINMLGIDIKENIESMI